MQSIRGRILMLFVFCLIFGGALTVLHYADMYSLKRKMVMMENFDTLLNNILELRRFEKNFTYYSDAASISSWKEYLANIETSFNQLGDDIVAVVGPSQYRQFTDEFGAYKKIMHKDIVMVANGRHSYNVEEIRNKGKVLVEFAQNLISIKRQHINEAITRMLILPVAYFSIFVILTIIVFQLINQSILKPLYLIRNATKHVASESFKPIVYHSKHENEITKLIAAFNRMAVQLESRQEQLLQSRKLASIGTFTSGIAHELNNPLNNISLTAETLLLSFDDMDPKEMRGLLTEIVGQADRASHVVKNLLEFSRTEKPTMDRQEVKNILDRTVRFIKNQLLIKGVQLTVDIADKLPPIMGKQQQLVNALVNIIINAMQAMPEGGSIGVRAAREGNDRVRIDISDTGVGIPTSDMEHIFDPFYTTKEVGKGTGLGLSLVYGIVHSHGGTIKVASRMNEGTTFSIFLPIATEKDDNSDAAVSGSYS